MDVRHLRSEMGVIYLCSFNEAVIKKDAPGIEPRLFRAVFWQGRISLSAAIIRLRDANASI